MIQNICCFIFILLFLIISLLLSLKKKFIFLLFVDFLDLLQGPINFPPQRTHIRAFYGPLKIFMRSSSKTLKLSSPPGNEGMHYTKTVVRVVVVVDDIVVDVVVVFF